MVFKGGVGGGGKERRERVYLVAKFKRLSLKKSL